MKNHFWTPAKRHTSRGYPGQQHMTKKNHQIALKVSKNWPSFWLCPRKFQRNYLGLGSLVGLGSFAVRPGSCPFFRQIKRKGITLSFNWGWSFTNSGLGLDSGSQILWCRGPTDDMIHDKLSLSTLILECKEYLLILECKTQANCCVCINELWAVLRIQDWEIGTCFSFSPQRSKFRTLRAKFLTVSGVLHRSLTNNVSINFNINVDEK